MMEKLGLWVKSGSVVESKKKKVEGKGGTPYSTEKEA